MRVYATAIIINNDGEKIGIRVINEDTGEVVDSDYQHCMNLCESGAIDLVNHESLDELAVLGSNTKPCGVGLVDAQLLSKMRYIAFDKFKDAANKEPMAVLVDAYGNAKLVSTEGLEKRKQNIVYLGVKIPEKRSISDSELEEAWKSNEIMDIDLYVAYLKSKGLKFNTTKPTRATYRFTPARIELTIVIKESELDKLDTLRIQGNIDFHTTDWHKLHMREVYILVPEVYSSGISSGIEAENVYFYSYKNTGNIFGPSDVHIDAKNVTFCCASKYTSLQYVFTKGKITESCNVVGCERLGIANSFDDITLYGFPHEMISHCDYVLGSFNSVKWLKTEKTVDLTSMQMEIRSSFQQKKFTDNLRLRVSKLFKSFILPSGQYESVEIEFEPTDYSSMMEIPNTKYALVRCSKDCFKVRVTSRILSGKLEFEVSGLARSAKKELTIGKRLNGFELVGDISNIKIERE